MTNAQEIELALRCGEAAATILAMRGIRHAPSILRRGIREAMRHLAELDAKVCEWEEIATNAPAEARRSRSLQPDVRPGGGQ